MAVGCGTAPQSKRPVIATATAASIPQGFRRTAHGWEDASTWGVVRDEPEMVEHWLQVQRQREPEWMRTLLSRIRSTSPLTVALIQIAAIACIFRVSRVNAADGVQSEHVPYGGGNLRDQ